MLFLAVTLGFFVENQREHYIEHQRAKVYAASMKANLQVDTAELGQIVYRGTYAAGYLDTFLLLLLPLMFYIMFTLIFCQEATEYSKE